MNSGRTSHDNDVHRTVCQKSVEVSVGLSTMLACETANFLDVGSINGSYRRTRHCSHSARVCFRDVAAADEPNRKHIVSIVVMFTM
jgi:hypothetical protein